MDPTVALFTIVVWLLLCAVVAHFAGQRGHSPGLWFVLALLLCPIPMVLILAVIPRGLGKHSNLGWVSRSHRTDWSPPTGGVRALSRDPMGLTSAAPRPGAAEGGGTSFYDRMKYRVARAGQELGEFTLAELRERYTMGEFAVADQYWDARGGEWRTLGGLL